MTHPDPEPIPMTQNNTPDDPNDRGLTFDLGTIIARRRALLGLGVVGVGAAMAYLAFGGASQAEPNLLGTAADGSTCLKDPAETAGPFPGGLPIVPLINC